MARSAKQIRKRRLDALRRRVEWLTACIAADTSEDYNKRGDRDRAECAALRWAVSVVQAAIDIDTIEELEEVARCDAPPGYFDALVKLIEVGPQLPPDDMTNDPPPLG